MNASTSGGRRKRRGIVSLIIAGGPSILTPSIPRIVETLLPTTTTRPDSAILSRKTRGIGQTVLQGSMMLQPYVPMIIDALKPATTTQPPPTPIHQVQQQPHNYQPLSNRNPYEMVNGN